MLTCLKTTKNWQLEISEVHYTAVQKASRPSFYLDDITGELKVRNFALEMIDVHDGNITHQVFEWMKSRGLREGKLLLVDRSIKEKKQITLEKWMLIGLQVVTVDFGVLEHNADGDANNATKITLEVSCTSAYLLPVEKKEVQEQNHLKTSVSNTDQSLASSYESQ